MWWRGGGGAHLNEGEEGCEVGVDAGGEGEEAVAGRSGQAHPGGGGKEREGGEERRGGGGEETEEERRKRGGGGDLPPPATPSVTSLSSLTRRQSFTHLVEGGG